MKISFPFQLCSTCCSANANARSSTLSNPGRKIYLPPKAASCMNAPTRKRRTSAGKEKGIRRPPRDWVNALLSFINTILHNDMRSALEVCGLDPAVGFLHRDRPGRMSLALDLMEEFRPFVADRLVLSLINLKQIEGKSFDLSASGAVLMNEKTRKIVIASWQTGNHHAPLHRRGDAPWHCHAKPGTPTCAIRSWRYRWISRLFLEVTYDGIGKLLRRPERSRSTETRARSQNLSQLWCVSRPPRGGVD